MGGAGPLGHSVRPSDLCLAAGGAAAPSSPSTDAEAVVDEAPFVACTRPHQINFFSGRGGTLVQ